MANIELLSEFNRQYPEKNIPFLHRQNADWEKRKPLRGVKILHNLINSFETLHKLEPLLRAGAELTLTRFDLIQTPYQKQVDEILTQCGFRYIPNYQDLEGEFDIGMDCAARILSIPQISIRRGIVELTQSGTVRYQKTATPYPVISVDDSYLKNLECMYGTGEAFVRAFQELSGEKLNNRRFLIFGYGKIGQGIVKYLSPFTRDIQIVEKSKTALERAARRGLSVISADHLDEIKKAASEAFGIVTATGISDLLSRYLQPQDIKTAYLANMGAEDEIGSAFSTRVLNHRFPINFGLKHPTLMKYLDPIFYAHNQVAEMLLQTPPLAPGYHAMDPEMDRKIVQEWVEIHHEAVDDIWDSK